MAQYTMRVHGFFKGLSLFLFLLASPAVNAGEPLPGVDIELVAQGLNAPIFLVSPADGSGRRFIGE